MSDEQHRMQQSLFRAVREGVEGVSVGGAQTAASTDDPDDDYVRATSGNRYLGLPPSPSPSPSSKPQDLAFPKP